MYLQVKIQNPGTAARTRSVSIYRKSLYKPLFLPVEVSVVAEINGLIPFLHHLRRKYNDSHATADLQFTQILHPSKCTGKNKDKHPRNFFYIL